MLQKEITNKNTFVVLLHFIYFFYFSWLILSFSFLTYMNECTQCSLEWIVVWHCAISNHYCYYYMMCPNDFKNWKFILFRCAYTWTRWNFMISDDFFSVVIIQKTHQITCCFFVWSSFKFQSKINDLVSWNYFGIT